MKIIKFPLGQLQANCYFLVQDDQCVIIDPSDDASFILEELQRRRLKLIAMLGTHGHFDHIMAIGEIQQSFNVPYYLNIKDKFLVERVEETASHFLGFKQIILKPRNIIFFKDNDLIKIKDFDFKVIKTPGHTPGSVCYYFEKEKIIFTGDTLFKGSIGRYDFSYCSKTDLKKSLITLSKLPDNIIVYPGHEDETTIKDEKNNLSYFIDFLK